MNAHLKRGLAFSYSLGRKGQTPWIGEHSEVGKGEGFQTPPEIGPEKHIGRRW
jgi:hypothetical protein